MFTNALSFAHQGLRANWQQFAKSAERISDPNAVTSIEEIAKMKQAELGIKANTAVIRKVNDISDYLVDIVV